MKRDDIVLIPQPNNYTCNATSVVMLAGEKDDSKVMSIYADLQYHGAPGCKYNLNAQLTHMLRGEAAVSLNVNASLDDLDAALDRGEACMTHGYFTKSGHIIVIVGRNATGYKVLDPWSEFDGPTFSYNKGSFGYAGIYSRGLIYAACVESSSVEEAYSIYDSGWDWSNNSDKGMWLHTVAYKDDLKVIEPEAEENVIKTNESVARVEQH